MAFEFSNMKVIDDCDKNNFSAQWGQNPDSGIQRLEGEQLEGV